MLFFYFRRKEDADKAKSATEEELKLYDQVMHVSAVNIHF